MALTDGVSSPLRTINSSMDNTIKRMQRMDDLASTGISGAGFSRAADAVEEMSGALVTAQAQAQRVENEIEGINQDLRATDSGARRAGGGFAAFGQALTGIYSGIQLVQMGIGALNRIASIPDTMTSGMSRLNAMNEGLGDTYDLQQKLFESANRARTSYQALLGIFSSIKVAASGVFSGNDAFMLEFTELLSKDLQLSGTSGVQLESALLQLTQGLGSGALQGEEFRSILENAPGLVNRIAEEMGVARGQLKGLASEGKITSDIIVSAIMSSKDEINAAFEEAPMTWSAAWQKMGNDVLQEAQPALQVFSNWVNSDAFSNLTTNISSAINVGIQMLPTLINLLVGAFGLLSGLAGFIAENWNWLGPIILGVTAAVGLFNVATGISNGLVAISTALGLGQAAATTAVATTTGAATAATWGLNAALMANPITWIILAVVALIAILVALIMNFEEVGYVATAVLYGILNVLQFFAVGWMMIFEGMINYSILMVNLLIKALNLIPGVSIPEFEYASFGRDAASKYQQDIQDRSDSLAAKRAELDSKKAEKDSTEANSSISQTPSSMEEAAVTNEDWKSLLSGGVPVNGGTLDGIDGEVSLADEDIKYLRDIATLEYVNQYTTLRPTVKATFGDVRETADVDGIITRFEDSIEQSYQASMRR
jgi:tape measure domain-containing protein